MLKKYFKIYKVFIENGISFATQYRKNTWLNLLLHFLWLGTLLVSIEVVFGQTQSIAGWQKHEVYLLTMIWTVTIELFLGIFGANITYIPDAITDGALDTYLVKPANVLFLISTKFFLLRAFFRTAAEVAILGWVIWNYHFIFSLARGGITILLMALGISVAFSLYLLANTLAFWFYRIDNINNALEAAGNMSRFPLDVLPNGLRLAFLTALPIGFYSYVPAAAFTGRLSWLQICGAFAFGFFLFYLAIKFWNFSLKRYSSASS